jgi:DNA-binding MarR family transcriptional regulator
MNEESPRRNRNAGLRRHSMIAWLHLLRIRNRVVQTAASQYAARNLSNAQVDALSHIGGAEGISQLDLAQRLFVTQGNITQLLEKMEARGLIRRISDGRTKRLYLTPTGRQLFDEIVPFHYDFIVSQFSALTPDELRQLLHLLAKLDRAQRQQAMK